MLKHDYERDLWSLSRSVSSEPCMIAPSASDFSSPGFSRDRDFLAEDRSMTGSPLRGDDLFESRPNVFQRSGRKPGTS